MSDVSLSLQQQVNQAIAQLSKSVAQSSVAQKGVEVLIQRLTTNQLLFTDNRSQRQIQIDKPNLEGKLITGQSYQAIIEVKNTQTLMSFLPAGKDSVETSKLANLSQTQLNNVIKAVGEKLVAGQGEKPLILDAKVVSTRGRYVTLQLKAKGQNLKVTIPIPKDMETPKPGQQVQVQLMPAGKQWQVKLLPAQPQAPGSALLAQASDKVPANAPTANSKIQGKELANLLQSSITQNLGRTSSLPTLEIPKSAIVKLAMALPSVISPAIKQSLISTDNIKLILQPDTSGNYRLQSQTPKTVATVNLSPNSIEQIKTTLPELFKPQNPNLSTDASLNSNTTQQIGPRVVTNVDTSQNQQNKVVYKELINLLRRVLPSVQSPSEALLQLDKVMNTKQIQDPQLKSQIEQLINQVKQAIPQGKPTDSESIKQILTTTPLNLTPANLTTPSNQQGLMGGLVALLQVALASRVARHQNQLSERMSQFVSQLGAGKTAATTTTGTRTNLDLNQLDQRGQTLREIGKIFASHQANKLANAEQALQGQDSFYYTLPSAFGNTAKDIELLIRREPEKQENKDKKSTKNSTWHLTMKLSVGEVGEMLTKARLTKDYLEVDFYTSNEKVKVLILEYLPLLKKRFDQLGIEMGKTQCQLGKIPTSLQNKPYGIFEAKA